MSKCFEYLSTIKMINFKKTWHLHWDNINKSSFTVQCESRILLWGHKPRWMQVVWKVAESYFVEASEGLQGQFHSTHSPDSAVVMGGKDGRWLPMTSDWTPDTHQDRKVGRQADPWHQLGKLTAERLLIKT